MEYNETAQTVLNYGASTTDDLAALGVVLLVVLVMLFGIALGRAAARPTTLQRSVLREALDVYTGQEGTTGERRQVALQLRHGRVLSVKYNAEGE